MGHRDERAGLLDSLGTNVGCGFESLTQRIGFREVAGIGGRGVHAPDGTGFDSTNRDSTAGGFDFQGMTGLRWLTK